MFKRILSMLLIITTFLSFSGFSSSKQQEVDLSTPQAKIEQSILQYPATNEDFRYDVYTYYVAITQCLSTKSNIIIPDTIQDLPVYIIAPNAFAKQTAITSVTMTNNIIEIGESAFNECVNLQSVSLSKNLEICGSNAFADCDNIKAVTIPGSLYSVPSNMFYNCDRLTAVVLEESASSNSEETEQTNSDESGRLISSGAFSRCEMLKNVWIPMEMTVESGAFSDSMENLTIYGEAQSSAAHYASENLLDFVVLGKNEFKNIMSNAVSTEEMSLDSSIESDTWKITFCSALSLRSQFNYTSNGIKKEKKLKGGNELVVLCFSVKNISSSKQYFNFLDTNTFSNDYMRKISSYGSIECQQLSQYNRPLVGNIESGEILYGYIALETTADWKTASVQFLNDTALENYNFIIKSNDKNVTYIGSVESPVESENAKADTTDETTKTPENVPNNESVENTTELVPTTNTKEM